MNQLTLPDNVKPVRSPRSRPSMQYSLIPSMIRKFFNLQEGDLLKWDIEGEEIVVKVVKKEALIEAVQRRREAQSQTQS